MGLWTNEPANLQFQIACNGERQARLRDLTCNPAKAARAVVRI
jgi:hypothetical protein